MKINSIINSVSYFAAPEACGQTCQEYTPQTEVGFHQFVKIDQKENNSSKLVKVNPTTPDLASFLLDLESIPVLSPDEEIFLKVYLKIFGHSLNQEQPIIKVDWSFPDGKIKSDKKKYENNSDKISYLELDEVPLKTKVEVKKVDHNKEISSSKIEVFVKPVIREKEVKIPAVQNTQSNIQVISKKSSSKKIITKVIKTEKTEAQLIEENTPQTKLSIEASQKGSIESHLKINQAQNISTIINKDRLTNHDRVEELSHSSNQERQPSK
jgi:hypothetical protein